MIYGERIRFRHVEREDLPTFVRWVNDPEVRAGIAMYLPMSMASEEMWFDNMLKRPPDEQPLGIEIQDGEEWRIIGNCAYFKIEQINRVGEVGIMIGEKTEWNKGYGTEAMQLLLKHGFETLNLNRVYLRVYATNARAIRAYEKFGFIIEGQQREAHYLEGKYIDVVMMSVLRSEWREKDQLESE